jgi:ABC-2 type transport system ATP-binding protein
MDEPTVGIDPQSRNSILETVKNLCESDGLTVVYTSHYMEEVEFLCRRLAIMDNGNIIAYGDLEEVRTLAGDVSTINLRLDRYDSAVAHGLTNSPGIRHISCTTTDGNDTMVVLVDGVAECLPRILEALSRAGRKVGGIQIQEPNLESVFLSLTGRALRD